MNALTRCDLISLFFSQWCGASPDHCGTCCQNGPCDSGFIDPMIGTIAPPGFDYDATHGPDSRMIAYVANWQACPTPEQVDAYSHIVIAFAVSYTYLENNPNDCDLSCNITPSPVPVCVGADANTIPDWQAAGKKVSLSSPDLLC